MYLDLDAQVSKIIRWMKFLLVVTVERQGQSTQDGATRPPQSQQSPHISWDPLCSGRDEIHVHHTITCTSVSVSMRTNCPPYIKYSRKKIRSCSPLTPRWVNWERVQNIIYDRVIQQLPPISALIKRPIEWYREISVLLTVDFLTRAWLPSPVA